jgi:2,3-dihydroxybenzoate-AMP ligase
MLEGFTPFPPEFAARYRAQGYWEDRSLGDAYTEAFVRHGDRTAIVDGDYHISYRELNRQVERLALHLLDLGVRPLDRLVMQLPNTREFVYHYFALQRVGAIPIMALPPHRYLEIKFFVEHTEAVGLAVPERMGDFDFIELANRVRTEVSSLRVVLVGGGGSPPDCVSISKLLTRDSGRSPEELKGIVIDPTDPAVFQLSGGTTGVPKVIPRTHNDYLYTVKVSAAVVDLRADDTLLVVLPVAHNFPPASPGIQGFLLAGARLVLSTSNRPEYVFPLIEREQVTHLDLLPHVTVQEVFGMAEGLLVYVRLDDPDEVRMETAGRPISPDDEIRLVDEDGNEVAEGEIGELQTRGPYTLRGYFRAPEHNTRVFTPDGFYATGDLMRRHPSGNYTVEGRKKDLINRGGEKISAEEIENLILSHPAVLNVARVPMPDPVLGERTCAFVILRPGMSVTLPELTAYLLE